MPRTKGGAVPRRNIRIPKPMMDEAERIVVEHPELYNNRQQFIETAIREKTERHRLLELRVLEGMSGHFLARVKAVFLAHAIANTVKEERLPAHHRDLKRLGQFVRRYLLKRAEREGRELTGKRLDELTDDLLEYHKEIMAGLALVGRQ